MMELILGIAIGAGIVMVWDGYQGLKRKLLYINKPYKRDGHNGR
jgi:hypothetical protein